MNNYAVRHLIISASLIIGSCFFVYAVMPFVSDTGDSILYIGQIIFVVLTVIWQVSADSRARNSK